MLLPEFQAVDRAMAMSLIEMGVVGIPLLLALFQFLNNHRYSEKDETIELYTVLFGSLALGSSGIILLFYVLGTLSIWSHIGKSAITLTMALFAPVLLLIVRVVVRIQTRQMIVNRFQTALDHYITAVISFFLAIGAFIAGFGFFVWVGVLTTIFSLLAAFYSQYTNTTTADNGYLAKLKKWRSDFAD